MHMTISKKVVAMALAVLMVFSSFSVLASADGDPTGTLTVMTKIFKDDGNGQWVEAGAGDVSNKVSPGEEVLLRVFVGTDFYSDSANLQFAYNPDFFEFDTSSLTPKVGYPADTYELDLNASNSTVSATGMEGGIEFPSAGELRVVLASDGSGHFTYSSDSYLFQIPVLIADTFSSTADLSASFEVLTGDDETDEKELMKQMKSKK